MKVNLLVKQSNGEAEASQESRRFTINNIQIRLVILLLKFFNHYQAKLPKLILHPSAGTLNQIHI